MSCDTGCELRHIRTAIQKSPNLNECLVKLRGPDRQDNSGTAFLYWAGLTHSIVKTRLPLREDLRVHFPPIFAPLSI